MLITACSTKPKESPTPITQETMQSDQEIDTEPTVTQEAQSDDYEVTEPAPTELIEEVIETPTEELSSPGLPLPRVQGNYFSGSGVCAVCHTNMEDGSGIDVSIDTYWRSTMMANASRDPYWRASVSGELLDNPDFNLEIQDTCSTCHMPMAYSTVKFQNGMGMIFGDGFSNPEHQLFKLASDGVSCTLCHQIESENLGQISSFNGGYDINDELEQGERINYGPYFTDETDAIIMQGSSGFIPVKGDHIQESELCATCHTLFTPTIGSPSSKLFPEQVTYFEWLNSDFSSELSCQACHMPEVDDSVQLSITGGEPRSPFSKHSFVGGNAYMLKQLKTHGDELDVTASSEQFDRTIGRVTEQLNTDTATISIEDVEVRSENISFEISIQNSVGHKLPSGYPSRRMWLHVWVTDDNGQVIFESGAWSTDGEIIGNNSDEDTSTFEPHYTEIIDDEQVQIYEAVFTNYSGEIITELLHGYEYIKDNRLIPAGFDKTYTDENIAVVGQALEDPNFVGGSDRISFLVDTNMADSLITINAELLYQSIGYNWVLNLSRHSNEQVTEFIRYYESIPNSPMLISEDIYEFE